MNLFCVTILRLHGGVLGHVNGCVMTLNAAKVTILIPVALHSHEAMQVCQPTIYPDSEAGVTACAELHGCTSIGR